VNLLKSVNFIDIHTHILPGIDDGARDLDESLLIIKEAIGVGVTEMILTPHFPYGGIKFNDIFDQFTSVVKAVSKAGLDITLHLATELMLCPELPELIKGDKRLTINGKGQYVLIEMPLQEIPFYAPDVLFRLLTQGVTPIWAHPERCYEVIKDYKTVSGYVNNGVLLQINAGSPLGRYGNKVRKTSMSLLKKGFGDIIASDTHKKGEINATWPAAYTYLEKAVGDTKAADMAFYLPSRLF